MEQFFIEHRWVWVICVIFCLNALFTLCHYPNQDAKRFLNEDVGNIKDRLQQSTVRIFVRHFAKHAIFEKIIAFGLGIVTALLFF